MRCSTAVPTFLHERPPCSWGKKEERGRALVRYLLDEKGTKEKVSLRVAASEQSSFSALSQVSVSSTRSERGRKRKGHAVGRNQSRGGHEEHEGHASGTGKFIWTRTAFWSRFHTRG